MLMGASRQIPIHLWLISALFLLKALFLGLVVTPLWDVPDETGHFSYVRDIAEGKGIPLLGQAEIGADVMSHLRGQPADAVSNWIAQHPPVYYLLATLPFGMAGMFTDNQEVLFKIPRVVAALSGALLLVVLFRTLILVGVDRTTATAMAVSALSFPMFSHLAGGTNNDVPLFLFSGLATYFWARHILGRAMKDAYWCAFFLAVAASTKMTALVLLAPMLLTIVYELEGSWAKKGIHALLVTITALSLPSLWLVRNFIHFGEPFKVAKGAPALRAVAGMDLSFLDYLSVQPVIEHFVVNFIGLLGWMGTGKGQMHWFQIHGGPLTAFSFAMLFFALVLVLFLFRQSAFRLEPAQSEHKESAVEIVSQTVRRCISPWTLKMLFLSASFLIASMIFVKSHNIISDHSWVRLMTASLLVFSGTYAAGLLFLPSTRGDRLALYSLFIFLVFTGVLLHQVYGAYLWYGVMRATHGRYFYPVMPVLLIAIGIALKTSRIPPWIIVGVAIALAYFEFETFLTQVVPFYMGAM
jgi:hypothetical protein